ncbi:MAG: hypothetical protein H6510_13255 [Acidobacteria bacterium]|nr:hypothetical protein [Acidobacteriota bacterium]MCB9398775.1 hypothetical protein [Acidobacteriota bacterium]
MLFLLMFGLVLGSDTDIPFGLDIPQAEWQVGPNPDLMCYDAAILNEQIHFHSINIDHYLKIRIFSERGKSAADSFVLSGRASKLEGRVIDRSGAETRFGKEDLIEQLAVKNSDRKTKVKVLVPPGLTADCIVELMWSEGAQNGLPSREHFRQYWVSSDFYCYKKSFFIHPTATRSDNPFLSPRFVWSGAIPPMRQVKDKIKGVDMIQFENILPDLDHPFAVSYYDSNAAYLLAYHTFPNYGNKEEEFWKNFCSSYIKDLFGTGISKSGEYRDWVKSVKEQLPAEPVMRLVFAAEQFRLRIQQEDRMPYEKKVALRSHNDKYLDQKEQTSRVFERGTGDMYEIGLLFYQFAKDLDLDFEVLFTGTTDDPFFPGQLNPYGLNISYPLFCYRKDQYVAVMPEFAEYNVGFFPAVFQGGTAIAIDPNNKFKYEIVSIPRQGANSHFRVREYAFDIKQDGQTAFQVQEYGGGNIEARFRYALIGLPPEEQREWIEDSWEARLASYWDILETQALQANALNESPKIVVKAQTHFDIESARLNLAPFPGQTFPISFPNHFPEPRSQPILLPSCLNQVDVAQIRAPKGVQLLSPQNWSEENEVGKVTFQAAEQQGVIAVRRDIVLKRDILKAEELPLLKTFLAWMDEAAQLDISLGFPKP